MTASELIGKLKLIEQLKISKVQYAGVALSAWLTFALISIFLFIATSGYAAYCRIA